MCLGHDQRLSEKEEIQEFLKRVGKLTVGAGRLLECDTSHLKLEDVVTAEAARGWLGPGWPSSGTFLLLL